MHRDPLRHSWILINTGCVECCVRTTKLAGVRAGRVSPGNLFILIGTICLYLFYLFIYFPERGSILYHFCYVIQVFYIYNKELLARPT